MNVEEVAGQGAAAHRCRNHVIDVEVQVLASRVLRYLQSAQFFGCDGRFNLDRREVAGLALAMPGPLYDRDYRTIRAERGKVTGNSVPDGVGADGGNGARL
ncbi:hypothetical protein B382_19295 [Stutzerimonas stutzeri B1SMN1]|nr:hypothetical protein B382_19295 [Stutzerimonas stutzeri B1SMN1]